MSQKPRSGGHSDADARKMKTDDRSPSRWIGLLVGAALVLGACSSTSTDDAAAEDTSPSALALDDAASTDEAELEPDPADAVFDIAAFTSLADLEDVELTPEIFELLKVNEASREAILVEMRAQGLDAEQSVCFLDQVSPGLFIAFGTGQQPDDAQFGELLGLLDTCGIAFG